MQAKINVSVPLEHCEIMFGLVDTLEQNNENDPKLVAMIDLIQSVIDTEGPGAVHGSFVRGRRVMVEVLNREDEDRVQRIPPPAP